MPNFDWDKTLVRTHAVEGLCLLLQIGVGKQTALVFGLEM